MIEALADYGVSLSAAAIEAGLRELCPDLAFDSAVNRPGDVEYALTTPTPAHRRAIERNRQPVCYDGRYVCAMDRGQIPEHKVWTVIDAEVPASLGEADQEDVTVRYETVPPFTFGYADLYDDAKRGRLEDYQIRPDGRLMRIWAVRIRKARGRCVTLGWRHTFERLVMADVPGITRRSLAEKFNVDMSKVFGLANGDIMDALAAMTEE